MLWCKSFWARKKIFVVMLFNVRFFNFATPFLRNEKPRLFIGCVNVVIPNTKKNKCLDEEELFAMKSSQPFNFLSKNQRADITFSLLLYTHGSCFFPIEKECHVVLLRCHHGGIC